MKYVTPYKEPTTAELEALIESRRATMPGQPKEHEQEPYRIPVFTKYPRGKRKTKPARDT